MSDGFVRRFARESDLIARAPGRVNLIGEHTDYNGGFVLPMTISQQTIVEMARRDDDRVQAVSSEMSAAAAPLASYTISQERKQDFWLDYLQGVTRVLHDDGFVTGGFDVLVTSTVPIGAGLSSSASFTVALLRGLRKLCELELDDIEIALLAQRAETDFVGVPVGVMDPMAISLGVSGTALFLDTRSLAHRRLPLPPEAEVVVVDSGQRRSLVDGAYSQRRTECHEAAALLGVHELRDLDAADLSQLNRLPHTLRRRARHVITENRRVKDAVLALEHRDVELLGELFIESHASMRDDLEVSTPRIDALVTTAVDDPDVLGARLTGGGFGGAIVILARAGAGRAVGERVAKTQAGATVIVPAPALEDGFQEMSR